MPYCLHIIIVVKPIYQEFFNTIMVGLLLYGANKVESARTSTHNKHSIGNFVRFVSIATGREPV